MNDENTERLISKAYSAIYFGRSRDQIVNELRGLGCDEDTIFLIYHAARILYQ